MRVAVMNHERLAYLLGNVDVRAEPLELYVMRCVIPVKIQPGLADGAYFRPRRQGGDLGQHGLALCGSRGCRASLVRVDCDGGKYTGERGRTLDGPARGRGVAANCDDLRDTCVSSLRERIGHSHVDHVEMTMAVERGSWQWQRLSSSRPANPLAGAESLRHWAVRQRLSSLASSSSTTEVSSLANSGTGVLSAVPGLIGAELHRWSVR